MNYQEFQLAVGKLSPVQINGQNSIHYVMNIIKIAGDYNVAIPFGKPHEIMLDTILLLEKRGAKRHKDYSIGCRINEKNSCIELVLSTTTDFMVDEDFVNVRVAKE